jgi:cytochrome c oxidase assembly protein subunit 15
VFTPSFFNRYCARTIWGILILFFLGGLVRITGSGMGCPDWPKCFGSWVPPTSEDQLPADYETEYLNKRKEKVSRLAQLLTRMGFEQKANEIAGTKENLGSHAFNVRKTYTEYVNRLWGALTGILTLLAAVSSLQFWKSEKAITILSLLGLLFVVFNGWLGSVVVDTNLLGGIVTAHFVLAFLAIACFMMAYYWNKNTEGASTGILRMIIFTGLILSMVQLLSGTAVREEIDFFRQAGITIGLDNFDKLGSVFNVHRVLALASGILLIALYRVNRTSTNRPRTSLIILATLAIVIVQALTGIANIRFDFPAVAQLLHVVLGSMTMVSFIYLTIHEIKSKKLQYVN